MNHINAKIIEHSGALNASAHFDWFIERYVTEQMAEAQKIAMNLEQPKKARHTALIQWTAWNSIKERYADDQEVAKRGLPA